MLGVCVRIINALSVNMETVTLMGKDRISHAFCIIPWQTGAQIRVVLHLGKYGI